jgi:2-polyprenyl-6-methoxyphenol hydroxylase-like FAD-dependent oxidoreductase
MPTCMRLYAIIIGGGIGGLCLGQGLRKAGISVAVYEKGPRHADPHWLQGYQIHISPRGADALRRRLPCMGLPRAYKLRVSNAASPISTMTGFNNDRDLP